MAHTACLVCLISTFSGRSKKKEKKAKNCGTRSGHITNLKQSIFSFNIYGCNKTFFFVADTGAK
jgi:hypothetical protein